MELPIVIAVLGTGSIGMQHLQALRQIPAVRPVAVPCRETRIHELEQAGYTTAKSLAEAVGMQGATLAVIATDTGRHFQDGRSAVEYGVDVLIEKPLCADARQARLLCLEAAKARRKLFVGCVLRFSESLNVVRNWLGKVGALHAIRVECQSYLPDWRSQRPYRESYSARMEDGGVLRDLIHEVDYTGWLFGWPATLQASVENLGRLGIAADEAADLMWRTPTGATVSVRLDYLTAPTRRRLTAYGESGTLGWDGVRHSVVLMLKGQPPQELVSAQTSDDMLQVQARAFIGAAGGRCDDVRMAGGEDGVKALAVCDAARRASANRREEQVDYQ